ncbi:hypothetical protein KDRO_D06570 [Kluyveromyces lactis]|nr:hypothetical protein KDRO_D06570 [Kluyveromyces lactis]
MMSEDKRNGKRRTPGEMIIEFGDGRGKKRARVSGRTPTSCRSCAKSKKKCTRESDRGPCQLCENRGIECSFTQGEPGSLPTMMEHEWLAVFLNEDAPFYNLNTLNRTPQSPQQKYVSRSLNYSGSGGVYYGILGEYDPLLRDKFFQYDDNNECLFHEKFFRRIEQHGFSSIFAYKKSDVAELENFKLINLTHDLDSYLEKVGKLQVYIPALLTLYVKFILPDLPIFDGQAINSVFASSDDIGSERDYGEFSDPLLLLLLYRLTYRWFYYDTSIPMKGLDIMKGNDLQFIFGEEFFTVVWNQINRELIAPTLTTLKCMIIFYHIISFKNTGYRTPFEANFLSSIINTAYIMGLHIDCSDWNIPKDEKNLRKRLWWVILLLETWNKLAYSLPTLTMNNGTLGEDGLSSVDCFSMFDDIDDFFPTSTVYSFYLFVNLTCTTCNLVKTLFQGEISMDDPKISHYDDLLNEWFNEYSTLPLETNVSYSSITLCYVVSKILILRLKFKLIADDLQYNKLCFDDSILLFNQAMEILQGSSASGVSCFWYNFSRSQFFYLRDLLLILMMIANDKAQSLKVFRLVRSFREWLANNARTLKIVLPALIRINITIASLGNQVKRLRDEPASKLYN